MITQSLTRASSFSIGNGSSSIVGRLVTLFVSTCSVLSCIAGGAAFISLGSSRQAGLHSGPLILVGNSSMGNRTQWKTTQKGRREVMYFLRLCIFC